MRSTPLDLKSIKSLLDHQIQEHVSILGSVHWLAARLFKMQGFKWELRRNGELKLGLWRKSWVKNKRKPTPKRFVMVPGFGDSPLSWLAVLVMMWPTIRKKYDEVILVDFPGFSGFLSKEKSFHSMDLLIQATQDAFDELRPHTIMGHSMGGYLTSHYAAACGAGERGNPKKNYTGPAVVILVDPSGVGQNKEERDQLQSFLANIGREGFKTLRPHVFAREPFWFPLVSNEVAKHMQFEEISQLTDSFRSEHWVQDRLSKVRSKVWLIWGEKDTLLPAAHLRVWLDALKSEEYETHSKGVLLKGIGHSPHVENPAVTAAVLSQILLGRDPHPIGKRWWDLVS